MKLPKSWVEVPGFNSLNHLKNWSPEAKTVSKGQVIIKGEVSEETESMSLPNQKGRGLNQ